MRKCKFFFRETTSDTTLIEDYDIDTKDLPPKRHTLYAKGRDSQGYTITDSMYVWVFTFDIKENLVTKYFNPLKPDSARVKFEIKPDGYVDPDSLPSPISMQVEIRDKDSILVYGPRPLTYDEIKNQVLYWDGKDNGGQVVDFERGPFEAILTLRYRDTRQGPGEIPRRVSLKPTELLLLVIGPNEGSFTSLTGENEVLYSAVTFPPSSNEYLVNWTIEDWPDDDVESGDPDDPPQGPSGIFTIEDLPVAPDGRGGPLKYLVAARLEIEGSVITKEDSIKQDELDQCRQEYIDLNKHFLPGREEFVNEGTYVDPGHFPFSEINTGDYSWAIFTIAQHLENIRNAIGSQNMPVNSGYRNPVHNANIGGATESRHIYGDAVDIALRDYNNDGKVDREDWVYMRNAAYTEGATYIEPFYLTPTWIHMDWGH